MITKYLPATFTDCQCHNHLHDFNFSISLIRINMSTIFNQKLYEFTSWRRSIKKYILNSFISFPPLPRHKRCTISLVKNLPKNGGIIFLFKNTSLISNNNFVMINFFFYISCITSTIHWQQEASITEKMSFNFFVRLIHGQKVAIWSRFCYL